MQSATSKSYGLPKPECLEVRCLGNNALHHVLSCAAELGLTGDAVNNAPASSPGGNGTAEGNSCRVNSVLLVLPQLIVSHSWARLSSCLAMYT